MNTKNNVPQLNNQSITGQVSLTNLEGTKLSEKELEGLYGGYYVPPMKVIRILTVDIREGGK